VRRGLDQELGDALWSGQRAGPVQKQSVVVFTVGQVDPSVDGTGLRVDHDDLATVLNRQQQPVISRVVLDLAGRSLNPTVTRRKLDVSTQ